MKTDQEKHFDESIRKKLQEAEEDTTLLWEQIEPKLKPASSRWMRGFLLSDILLAVLFSGYLLAVNQRELFSRYDSAFINTSNEKIITGEKNNISSATAVTTNYTIALLSENKKRNISAEESTENISTATNNSQVATEEKEKHSIHSKEIISGRQLSSSEKNNQHLSSTENHFKKENKKRKTNPSERNKSGISDFIISSENNNKKNNPSNKKRNEEIAFIDALTDYNLPEEEINTRLKNTGADLNTPFIIAGSEQAVVPVAFELYGIFAADKTLSNNKTSNLNASYENENVKNPGYGVAIRYLISPEIFVSIGIQSTKNTFHINYSFSYDHRYTVIDSITGFIISPFDPPVPLTIYDTTIVTEKHSSSENIEITESNIQCPVTIGYRFTKNKWSVEGSAGIVYTVSQKQIFNYPELNEEETAAFSKHVLEFNKKPQLDGIAALSIARKISNRIECYMQSFYQHSFGSSTTADSDIEILRRTTGLKAGIRINLSAK